MLRVPGNRFIPLAGIVCLYFVRLKCVPLVGALRMLEESVAPVVAGADPVRILHTVEHTRTSSRKFNQKSATIRSANIAHGEVPRLHDFSDYARPWRLQKAKLKKHYVIKKLIN